MFANQYDHELLRKYVIIFGNLFNDIAIQRFDQDGTKRDTLTVPLSYAPKEKFIARLRQNPDLDQSVAINLPRMGFEINSFAYDPERQLPPSLRNFSLNPGKATTVKSQFVPVPYDISFSLSVFAGSSRDGNQIVEQILPYFRPEFTANAKLIDDMNIVVDLPVVLQSAVPSELYEGDFETRQAWNFDFEFMLKGYFFGPVTNKGVINRVIVDVRDGLTSEAPILQRMTIDSANTVSINAYGYGF